LGGGTGVSVKNNSKDQVIPIRPRRKRRRKKVSMLSKGRVSPQRSSAQVFFNPLTFDRFIANQLLELTELKRKWEEDKAKVKGSGRLNPY
jgi:hypothetical protein